MQWTHTGDIMRSSSVQAALLEARRAKVRILYALPLSNAEIAAVLKVKLDDVNNDIARLKEEPTCPVRPTLSYRATVELYLQALRQQVPSIDADLQTAVARMLGESLKEAAATMEGIMTGIDIGRAGKIAQPHLQRTQRLANAIFAPRFVTPLPDSFDALLLHWWNDEGSTLDEIKGYKSLGSSVAMYAHRHSTMFGPPETSVVVSETTRSWIDKAFAELDERGQCVIQHRFPEDGSDAKSLREIGMMMSLPAERVRQFTMHALREMRDFLRAHYDISPVPTWDDVVVDGRTALIALKARSAELEAQVVVLREQNAECRRQLIDLGALEGRLEDSDVPVNVVKQNAELRKHVDELNLSVRARNCMDNAGCQYVWQICEKTEAEMLKTKNFGRKSLNELKDLFLEMGVSFGMTIPLSVKCKL